MAEPQKVGRSHALDGLRGIAALAVVFYHTILHNDDSLIGRVLYQPIQAMTSLHDVINKIVLILLNGEVAVFVFFVLSGCVLRLSLESKSNDSALSLCLRFTGARVLRLYPPVIACIIFFYWMSTLGITRYPTYTVHGAVLNALLWNTDMHSPSTTVQAEVFAIPFVIVAWLLRKWFGVALLGLAFIYSILAIESTAMVFHLPNMHGYLLAFFAGMLVAEPLLKPLFKSAPAGSWWAAAIGLVFCRTFTNHSSLLALIAMVLAAAILVGGLLYGQPGSLSRLLERPFAQALGRVSYSFYMFNVPILGLVWAFTERWAWPAKYPMEAGLVIGIVAAILTYPLAWASERWIERPSVRASRWVWKILRSNNAKSDAARGGALAE